MIQLKNYFRIALLSLALICIAAPSIEAQKTKKRAKTTTQKTQTTKKIEKESPSDKFVNAFNVVARELEGVRTQREMESVIRNNYEMNNLNLTQEELTAPLSDAEKNKVCESIINAFTIIGRNVGTTQSVNAMNALNDNVRAAVAKSNTLQEILSNCGLNMFTSLTGRTSF